MSDVLERGNIYFFYRPKLGETSPEAESEIQRFQMVLHPRDKRTYRLITVGRKHLPDTSGERTWGFVSKVGHNPEEVESELDPTRYQTKTRGERVEPAARPAGEGVYAIVDHDRHTHLAYALELPKKPGEVQKDLDIEESGSFIVSVKNPGKPSPPGAGLARKQKAEYPRKLQERFGERRFVDLNPPDFLDHEGAELMLIGANEHPDEELGISLEPEKETQASADVFRDLKLERDQHPTEPLFEGRWQ